jgi:UDP-N-acetylmuramoyl-L-alanyl-D-glutamate--2,6-diaminopimelate ligase
MQDKARNLADLASGLEPPPGFEVPHVLIRGITHDSRQVQPGYLFAALSGSAADGHRYIPDAIQRGASAVVGTQPLTGLAIPYLQVADSRRALASLAAAFYDYPARHLTMIGVTGTDGKTTTINLIFHILRAAGLQAGMVSTVNAVIGDEIVDTGFHVTTPDVEQVQAFLRRMVDAGLTHVILESTSHGLAQGRVAACDFDMAVVTNITHEHLDYHRSFAAYREAKGLLFKALDETPPKSFNPPHAAVLNRDDPSFDYLRSVTHAPVLSYSLDAGGQVHAEDIHGSASGVRFKAAGRDMAGEVFDLEVASCLVGLFNVYNCLAAIALTRGVMSLEDEAIAKGIADMPGVPGRMEVIDLGQDFTALVDFAHTPNALRSALQAARGMTDGRVIAVFGSAGLRDREKRSLMAQVAAELADLSVFTAEDPRSESLEVILAEMSAGAQSRGGVEGHTFWRLADRGEALRFALRLAQPGDLVIVCGKGHEQSMCFGEIEYPWDDRVALRAALSELLGLPGPRMPFLPTAQGAD